MAPQLLQERLLTGAPQLAQKGPLAVAPQRGQGVVEAGDTHDSGIEIGEYRLLVDQYSGALLAQADRSRYP